MDKEQFMYSFKKDFLFGAASEENLENFKLLIFKYLEDNSKLEIDFNGLDNTKLILTLPNINELFSINNELSDETHNYNLKSFIQ